MSDKNRVLLLRDLGKILPGNPSYRTLYRWATVGIKRNGRTVRMDGKCLPGGRGSSIQAYEDFCEKLSHNYRDGDSGHDL